MMEILMMFIVLIIMWMFKLMNWGFMINIMVMFFITKLNLCMFVSGISYGFGTDMVSMPLVMLKMLTCVLMMIASMKILLLNISKYYFCLMILRLNIILFYTFVSLNILVFYVLFEFSLIPTIILIM